MTSNSWSLSLIAVLLSKSLVDQIKPFTYDLGRRSLTVAEYPIMYSDASLFQWSTVVCWFAYTNDVGDIVCFKCVDIVNEIIVGGSIGNQESQALILDKGGGMDWGSHLYSNTRSRVSISVHSELRREYTGYDWI